MKEPLEIPLSLDTPLYTERVTLDGREYLLRFDWNGREGRWYLSIGTITEVWIRRGIKVVANWPLTRKSVDLRLPPGHLFAMDLTSNGEPPDFYDLGRRVKLFYFPV